MTTTAVMASLPRAAPMGSSLAGALAWSAILFAVFCPPAVWAYGRQR